VYLKRLSLGQKRRQNFGSEDRVCKKTRTELDCLVGESSNIDVLVDIVDELGAASGPEEMSDKLLGPALSLKKRLATRKGPNFIHGYRDTLAYTLEFLSNFDLGIFSVASHYNQELVFYVANRRFNREYQTSHNNKCDRKRICKRNFLAFEFLDKTSYGSPHVLVNEMYAYERALTLRKPAALLRGLQAINAISDTPMYSYLIDYIDHHLSEYTPYTRRGFGTNFSRMDEKVIKLFKGFKDISLGMFRYLLEANDIGNGECTSFIDLFNEGYINDAIYVFKAVHQRGVFCEFSTGEFIDGLLMIGAKEDAIDIFKEQYKQPRINDEISDEIFCDIFDTLIKMGKIDALDLFEELQSEGSISESTLSAFFDNFGFWVLE